MRSIFGPRLEQEIEVSVHGAAGEVSDLFVRFTLQPRNPPPLAEWAEFAVELCSRFRLRLGDEGTAPCSESEFLSAVKSDEFYQEFAAAFGWDTDGARPDAATDGDVRPSFGIF